MKTLKISFLTIAFMSLFVSCDAQYTGPGANGQTITVKNVIDNASKLDKTETAVNLTGYIIEKRGHEKYIFKDATGSVRVEIDDDELMGLTISDTTKVNIIGEVDSDIWEGVEIEVKRISIVK